MPDLFDFGAPPPPAPKPRPAPPPPPPPAPAPAQPAIEPQRQPPAGNRPRQGPRRVASFACYCGCHSEVREPAPLEIPCWGDKCKGMMHRWWPREEPPFGSAESWDGEKLVRSK